jgi:uncharacterized protein (TIGR02594 family)
LTLPWITEAQKHLGIKKDGLDDMTIVTDASYDPATQPWSGLFMAFVFAQIGTEPPPNFLDPKAWVDFGTALDEPAMGSIIVLGPGTRDTPHVGIYLGEDANYYFLLGGNQNDTVCVTQAPKGKDDVFRWPPDFVNALVKGRVNTTIEKAKL